ncbi:MAG TPA: hypothetical protein PKI14_03465 [Fervidobacterium sp.]|nr:hypothetical protein [Fervidobacterium sp.]HUM41990.1 hypothetical protein [Fervidobacterium sp.]
MSKLFLLINEMPDCIISELDERTCEKHTTKERRMSKMTMWVGLSVPNVKELDRNDLIRWWMNFAVAQSI